MKLEYTDSSNSIKQRLLKEYKGIELYFTKAENEILEKPFDSICETIIIDGRRIDTYKKTVKTAIFSGRFPNAYLYVSLSYAQNTDKTKLVVYGVFVRSYSP